MIVEIKTAVEKRADESYKEAGLETSRIAKQREREKTLKATNRRLARKSLGEIESQLKRVKTRASTLKYSWLNLKDKVGRTEAAFRREQDETEDAERNLKEMRGEIDEETMSVQEKITELKEKIAEERKIIMEHEKELAEIEKLLNSFINKTDRSSRNKITALSRLTNIFNKEKRDDEIAERNYKRALANKQKLEEEMKTVEREIKQFEDQLALKNRELN
jgi:chromosome segregation ATPase